MPEKTRKRISIHFHELWYPVEKNGWWQKSHKNCANEKLFLPVISSLSKYYHYLMRISCL